MTSTGVLVAITAGEVITITGAIFASVGWLYRGNQKRQDSQDSKLSEIQTSLAVVTSKADDRDARLTNLEKRAEESSGSLNALSLIVERINAIVDSPAWNGRDRRQRPRQEP